MIKKMNMNLAKVIHLLSDGEYHDGTTIGQTLGMTRSAVWKIIKKLEGYHIKIDSIKAKGYALAEPLTLLDLNKIKKKLSDKKCSLALFESVNSTNQYLQSLSLASPKKLSMPQICLAEQQTEGRGRLNRVWYSPFGKNIYLSCLYLFQKDVSELAGLSLVTSLAQIKALREVCDLPICAKWPNDLLYENKKLSGSLIDIQAESHGLSSAVIGIGMNVNMMDDKRHISQSWTSLQKMTGQYIDRNELAAHLIHYLIQYLIEFNKHGFSHFKKEWLEMDSLTNQLITIKNLQNEISGRVTGVNEQGHLLVKLANGMMRTFSTGDTSIMKSKKK